MSKIEDALEKLALPICADAGVYIYDTEYKKEGSNYYLRLYIDKDGGVTIEDCENVSRSLNTLLDEADIVKEAYIFEVSSPGIDRLLSKPWHYEKVIGEDVSVKLFAPVDSKKEIEGKLIKCDDETFTLNVENKEITIEKKQAASVRLAFKF